MDIGDVTQLIFVGTAAFVFGRLGIALVRLIDRRGAGSASPGETDARLRAVEDECITLRRELAEVQERQDFAERVLLRDPTLAQDVRLKAPDGAYRES